MNKMEYNSETLTFCNKMQCIKKVEETSAFNCVYCFEHVSLLVITD